MIKNKAKLTLKNSVFLDIEYGNGNDTGKVHTFKVEILGRQNFTISEEGLTNCFGGTMCNKIYKSI